MKTHKFTLLLAVIILFAASVNTSAAWSPNDHNENDQYWITEPYEYPVLPGTEEWKRFKNLREMITACAVPKDMLEHMTTPALVRTVLNYPLLGNAFFYPNEHQGLEAVAGYFEGMNELARREDGWKVVALMYWNYNRQVRGVPDENHDILLTKMSYCLLLHWTSCY